MKYRCLRRYATVLLAQAYSLRYMQCSADLSEGEIVYLMRKIVQTEWCYTFRSSVETALHLLSFGSV
jgi:hypothetical protein